MISGPLSSLPPDLESRLAAARHKTPLSGTPQTSGGSSGSGETPRQKPSDIMVAAVTARNTGAKTPAQGQVSDECGSLVVFLGTIWSLLSY